MSFSHSSTTLYTEAMDHWRQKAAAHWAEHIATDRFRTNKIPGYFIDRIGYSIMLSEKTHDISLPCIKEYSAIDEIYYKILLDKTISNIDAIGAETIRPDAIVPQISIVDELLSLWRSFLKKYNITFLPGSFQNPAGKTWVEFFANSVHYPKRPAIPGPTFFLRLSEPERRELINRYGPDGIIGLYIFLLLVHEETHLNQIGEPLLCEFFLAMLWCKFLSEEDQWHWQRSVDNQDVFNIEYHWVSQVMIDSGTRLDNVLDCFRFVACSARTSSLLTYEKFLVNTRAFDQGAIKYREFLDNTLSIIQNTKMFEI